MEKTLPRRDEAPQQDRWDVESVFADEAAFDEAFARVEADIPRLAPFAGTLGASAAALLAALQARDEVDLAASRLALYAGMRRSADETDPASGARWDRAWGLVVRFSAATAYVEPEILAIPAATLDTWTRDEQGLTPYRHYIEQLGLQRPHVRSREVEEVLAQASDVTAAPRQIHAVLENADLRFGPVPDPDGGSVALAQSNADLLITSDQRSVRQAAWRRYADGYLGVKNTMAATLAGAVKSDVFYARARRYDSAREASMQPHNIPVQVFDTLVDTVRAHLPLWHRYWAIRWRALGVDALRPYDLDAPLALTTDPIPFDRGVEMLLAGLAPLGEEYVAAARRGLTTERWVDKYPNVGKSSGAHSTGVYGTRPFLMQNYDDSLMGVSTLAHELGHSMHSWYTWRTQPPLYARYSMFVAETASNFNQALLRAHLLARSDDRRFQIAVIEEGMANFYRYFFIMPNLAQFERDAHERVERGGALTAHDMSERIVELFGEGYGGEVALDDSEDRARVGVTWAQFPHLFSNFYVWQYATGISAANALAAGVLSEGTPAAERYIAFLKAGDSLYPLDALRLAGVDMTSHEPIERAFGVLEGLVDRLDALVGDGPLPWLPAPDC